MYTAEFEGINSFLVGASKAILEHGVTRKVRGYECVEFPEPVMFKITNPTARWINIDERKWNVFLPYAESLWLASGRNDLKFIEFYLSKLKEFSDDEEYMRGGYGPRMRFFNGNSTDYQISSNPCDTIFENIVTDQFIYIEECFKKDLYNRQSVLTLSDPSKDHFNSDQSLKITKDLPCTRLLQFMCTPDKKLNLTVYMRSNDLIWGASGVNIFNYTFLQEYFAAILGLEIGDYYHIANNLHYYRDRHQNMIESIASKVPVDKGFVYKKNFNSLQSFDASIKKISHFENEMRLGNVNQLIDMDDDFFNDWAKVFYRKISGKKVSFINPILNEILN